MNKDDIIRNLSERNNQLNQQLAQLQHKYQRLEHDHNQLQKAYQQAISAQHVTSPSILSLQEIDKKDNGEGITKSEEPNKEQSSPVEVKVEAQEGEGRPEEETDKNIMESTNLMDSFLRTSIVADNHIPRQQPPEAFDFFGELAKKPELQTHLCELIEGCFIIEKISSIDHFDPIRMVYPPGKFDSIRSMFDIIYRFVFINSDIPEVQDDEFDSRKNEIRFGTPCEDFQFVFDNLNQKGDEKGRLNPFERSTCLLRKRYIYGVVRPQLATLDKQIFETELAYGFVSAVPFPNFFKDLNRIVQQQVKYRMLGEKKMGVGKGEKVGVISDIIREITERSLSQGLSVEGYPINLELNASVCGLKLVYSSKNNYVNDQLAYIQSLLGAFDLGQLVKILHYVLAEQHVVVVTDSRRALNQLFEVIRTIIYPFNWIFPIVYHYSPFFEPFLSSPLPILVGTTTPQTLPEHQFTVIYAQQTHKDQREVEGYARRIRKATKLLQGEQKQEKMSALRSDKGMRDKLAYRIYFYVRSLRQFVETGKLEEEPDEFHFQFMETQMVSYYKETLAERKASRK